MPPKKVTTTKTITTVTKVTEYKKIPKPKQQVKPKGGNINPFYPFTGRIVTI